MKFIELTIEHHQALIDFIADFERAGEKTIPAYFCPRDWPTERIVSALKAWSKGEQIKPGWVPCSTYFLEVEKALVGVLNIRHRLTEGLLHVGGHIGYSVRPSHRRKGYAKTMLAMAKEKCLSLGLSRVLVTCDPNNIGSRKKY